MSLEELSGSKGDIKLGELDKIIIEKTNISTDEMLGFEISEELKLKALFGASLIFVFGMYFYSRRKNKK